MVDIFHQMFLLYVCVIKNKTVCQPNILILLGIVQWNYVLRWIKYIYLYIHLEVYPSVFYFCIKGLYVTTDL